ncbi:MAG: hypothetical protein M1819_003217 [Sarea resinae]|nr:MAG: hypothetical protein M1819_003217 [Sarea resinae]
MNEPSPSLTSHTAPAVGPVPPFLPSPSYLTNGVPPGPVSGPQEEDEPYTIKCICNFQDDDGSTVFCERCETWQHIECYYPTRDVPDVHNCRDCEPRPLDQRRATERQRRRREQIDAGERKPKRPAGKSHKKKSTPSITQLNGWTLPDKQDAGNASDRASDSPREQPPPAKKPKTSHRSSSSISSQAGTPGLALDSRKRTGSLPRKARSPSKVPANRSLNGVGDELYTLDFMRLYREDNGDVPLQANLHSNIAITGQLSSWISDPEALAQATDGKAPAEVFQRVDRPIDSLPLPEVSKHEKGDSSLLCHGLNPLWKYLTVNAFVPEGSVVGELKGTIGHLQEYYQSPTNKWHSLRHPEPFVFFHPQLPIYIDTRTEGTKCRYVRRSCRPNMDLKTLISNGVEYHFCFFATEDLQPGTEITIGWDLDDQVQKYLYRFVRPAESLGVKQEGLGEAEEEYISTWVGRVLANFGGCACNGPQPCLLSRFDRRGANHLEPPRPVPLDAPKPKRSKKGRNQISPPSTGQATNSRAGSEGVNAKEHEDDHEDSRSTSGSVRSKPRSRDITPLTQISEGLPGKVPELSDREKRKIAALEKTFEQLEQGESAHKKKKRHSGGSNLNTPSTATSVRAAKARKGRQTITDEQTQKQLGHSSTTDHQSISSAPHRPRYVDAGTSRRQSGSPSEPSPVQYRPSPSSASPVSRPLPRDDQDTSSPLPSPIYADSSTQTDPEGDVWYYSSAAPKRKMNMSLTQRLLTRCHEDRLRLEERRRARDDPDRASHGLSATNASSPIDGSSKDMLENLRASPQMDQDKSSDGDVQMKDRDAETSSRLGSDSPDLGRSPGPPDGLSPISEAINNPIKPPPPPWPSARPRSPDSGQSPTSYRSAGLRVQLPPTPQFSNHSPSTASVAGTPTSSGTLVPQSPFGIGANSFAPPFSPSVISSVHPSPIKKKISFSDYVSRRSKAEPPGTGAATAAAAAAAAATTAAMSEAADKSSSDPTSANNVVKATVGDLPDDGKMQGVESETAANAATTSAEQPASTESKIS